ncbi:hypothetical protein B7486_16630 [cyanobacterium TDX16]|nr:hypothetical protein B7486_16630 [cyanobacterium TDX16]
MLYGSSRRPHGSDRRGGRLVCENPNMIQCHTCNSRVPFARHCKVRGDVEAMGNTYADQASKRLGRDIRIGSLTPDEIERERPYYEQYHRNIQYRSAFICEACYKVMDSSGDGSAEIDASAGPQTFAIAGESRNDRAAIYDHAKWLRFQSNQAAKMGIESE